MSLERRTMGDRETGGPRGLPGHEIEELRLESQFCFALYLANNRFVRVYGAALDAFGLTFTQTLGLMVLWEKSPRLVGDIARMLELESGTVTPLLKRLEVGGFVDRVRDSADERRVFVHITPKGLAVREAVLNAKRTVNYSFALPGEEIELLRQGLNRLSERLVRSPS